MDFADLEQHLLVVAKRSSRRTAVRTVNRDDPRFIIAKSTLQNEDATATACDRAAQIILGDGFHSWEPESVWLSLDAADVRVPLVNRDKLMAATTLTVVPAFWWEVNAYENTALAFNSVLSNPDVIQEATPAQLAWAVYEAELFYAQQEDLTDTPEFDREPVLYTAIVLNRAGFILAPDLLQFAQRALDDLTKDGAEVTKADVQSAWQRTQKRKLDVLEFSDSPLDVQLSLLAGVSLYVTTRAFQYNEELDKL